MLIENASARDSRLRPGCHAPRRFRSRLATIRTLSIRRCEEQSHHAISKFSQSMRGSHCLMSLDPVWEPWAGLTLREVEFAHHGCPAGSVAGVRVRTTGGASRFGFLDIGRVLVQESAHHIRPHFPVMCFGSLLFSLHTYSNTSGAALLPRLSERPSVLESSLDLQVPPVRRPCILPSMDTNNPEKVRTRSDCHR